MNDEMLKFFLRAIEARQRERSSSNGISGSTGGIMEPNYAGSECQDCGDIPADTYEHPSGDGTEYTFCPRCYARNLDEYYEALANDEAEREASRYPVNPFGE